MNLQNKQTEDHLENTVKNRVFETLDAQKISPRGKYVFLCQNWLVWSFWGVSIFIGALSVAVLMFVSTHRYYDIYEATHENFFTFMLEALPYVWIFIFGSMLLLASWQLKNTKRGYRFSLPVLGVSSFAFSIFLGLIFHMGGFGWSLDAWLGKVAPMYSSQIKMEYKMWQNPADGRLVGKKLISEEPHSSSTISFVDVDGVVWSVVIRDLSKKNRQYLDEGKRIRLLGSAADVSTENKKFHACGVFPWLLDTKESMERISKERQQFIDLMYQYHEDAESRKKALEEKGAEEVGKITASSPCHTLRSVKRVHESSKR